MSMAGIHMHDSECFNCFVTYLKGTVGSCESESALIMIVPAACIPCCQVLSRGCPTGQQESSGAKLKPFPASAWLGHGDGPSLSEPERSV